MSKRYVPIPKHVVQALAMAKLDIEQWLRIRIYGMELNFELKVVDKDFVIEGLEDFGEVYVYELMLLENGNEITDKISDIYINAFVTKPVWSLECSFTKREIEVLKKRIEKKKSLTETASEMGISPQGVVAFIRAIKNKVNLHLLDYAHPEH